MRLTGPCRRWDQARPGARLLGRSGSCGGRALRRHRRHRQTRPEIRWLVFVLSSAAKGRMSSGCRRFSDPVGSSLSSEFPWLGTGDPGGLAGNGNTLQSSCLVELPWAGSGGGTTRSKNRRSSK